MDRIAGYVDRVGAGVLSGWIANIDRPTALEDVVCRGPAGRALSFSPFVPRQDVWAALHAVGRFGFVIPIEALTLLGPVIDIMDRNGTPLVGGQALALPWPPPPPPRRPRQTMVIHIPKTAGTTLREALAHSLAPGEALFLYPYEPIGLSVPEMLALPPAQRAMPRLVMGHVAHGLAKHFPRPMDYVTVLRDPEARLRSNVYHHAARGGMLRIDHRPMELAWAAELGLAEEFDNIMVRMLAGQDLAHAPLGGITAFHLETALANLRRFRFVALAEHLDRHLPLLCQAVGLPVAPPARINTRLLDDSTEIDATIDWDQVLHRNRFDAELYARAIAEGLCGRDLRPA